MLMDPDICELSAILSGGIRLNELQPDQRGRLINDFKLRCPHPLPLLDRNMLNPLFEPVGPSAKPYPHFLPPEPPPHSHNHVSSVCLEEDPDIFSDIALKYINQILMDEDIEEKTSMHEVGSALRATEKPFYDILGEKYPPSPDHYPDDVDQGQTKSADANSGVGCSWVGNTIGNLPPFQRLLADQSTFSCSNIFGDSRDGLEESNLYEIRNSGFLGVSQPIWQFQRVEEANNLFSNGSDLILDKESSVFSRQESKGKVPNLEVPPDQGKDVRASLGNCSRGKKNPNRVDLDMEEGRTNKHSALYFDDAVRSDLFDMVLLCGGKCGPLSNLQEQLQNSLIKGSQNSQPRGSNGGGKSRCKKQGKKEVVDLRARLIRCAQAVAVDDRRNASELLKQIRQHSYLIGDGTQRLAHWFAQGLEARLAGTGSQVCMSLCAKRPKAVDILKAYHLYLAACPFKKISHFFANQTILNVADDAKKLHIVHYGINFGFQWPCFLQMLSKRAHPPPKVRITGIDLPQPGFRPAEMIEETGRRLDDYARSFNVPFEYTPIACKWETIQVEDLKLDRDEVLVVCSLFQFKGLLDETVVVDCPRNIVLNTIRKMNPHVFIHGIVNGAYNAPFFVTRFREALFHWSALFDMLEANVPRNDPQRTLIERELFGHEALNVIACEGLERVERPETYKKWQVRNQRAGLRQLPLDEEIMRKARDKMKNSYHKDFVIDDDNHWMLLGWKGRIIHALSSWKPDEK